MTMCVKKLDSTTIRSWLNLKVLGSFECHSTFAMNICKELEYMKQILSFVKLRIQGTQQN